MVCTHILKSISILTSLSPIFTYGGRATTKSGIEPSEHAIIHTQGRRPRLVPGEAILEKKSIAIVPAGSSVRLAPASRINFGIQRPIQHNVKVKDLGTVCNEDMPYLIGYFRTEKDNGSVEGQSPTLKKKNTQTSVLEDRTKTII